MRERREGTFFSRLTCPARIVALRAAPTFRVHAPVRTASRYCVHRRQVGAVARSWRIANSDRFRLSFVPGTSGPGNCGEVFAYQSKPSERARPRRDRSPAVVCIQTEDCPSSCASLVDGEHSSERGTAASRKLAPGDVDRRRAPEAVSRLVSVTAFPPRRTARVPPFHHRVRDARSGTVCANRSSARCRVDPERHRGLLLLGRFASANARTNRIDACSV